MSRIDATADHGGAAAAPSGAAPAILASAATGIVGHIERLHGDIDSIFGNAGIAPEMAGLNILSPPIAVLGEAQLFGQRARQERRRRRAASDQQAILRDLTALGPGSPVVHEE